MGRTVSIGAQSFEDLRTNNYFLVDKTDFIRQWWEAGDAVTLLCRPRRFGKTLNMSMLECFFSTKYAGRGEELFGGMDIWQHEEYRALQGTVPAIFLSFANVKLGTLEGSLATMKRILAVAVNQHAYLLESDALTKDDRDFLSQVGGDMPNDIAAVCVGRLCMILERHWGVAPIVLLDEYDTPMQEAWLGGYWDDMAAFVRSLFNSTFKTNPSLGRGLITGVTRVSRESIFSDLNNLAVVTTTTERYETCFGFTEEEVFAALDEMAIDERAMVKAMYDGFVFGSTSDIYNPWSVTNYLKEKKLYPFWVNSSGNGLVSELVRTGGRILQEDFETLLSGESIQKILDDQVVFSELGRKPNAVWSLLLATGYVKATHTEIVYGKGTQATLELVNTETRMCFDNMVRDWLYDGAENYNAFVKCILKCDFEEANDWLSALLPGVISTFDGGVAGGGSSAPENFYHGLVLGLLVELRGRYEVTNNRESGFGRYDVMLCPLHDENPAFVMEFKVQDIKREATFEDTCERALQQLRDRAYATQLVERGIAPARIHELAFAFSGKEVLIVSS